MVPALIKRLLAELHRRRLSRREEGVALVAVMIMLAVMGATASDFAYNARVDYTSAINARDELQAHYHARSAINLSRLLLRVQQKLIDPNRKFFGGLDIQIADYAPILISAFNSKEGAEALGSILGLEAAGIKGLGVESGSFDLAMESLDGKLNLNCGGGSNTGDPKVLRFAAGLAALMLPQRYNRLFEEPDEQGQYADRLEVMRAIIDWADWDTVIFGSSAAEDYRYDAGKDPYKSKDRAFDTVEELRLVKGIDDDFMAAFGNAFTVYGTGCQVNLSLTEAPVITALILQYAATPNDPALEWRNLALLTRYVVMIRDLMGGFKDLKAFTDAVENPMAQLGVASAVDSVLGGDQSERPTGLPPVNGIKLDPKIKEAVVVGGTRRIWRITAMAEVGRVRRKIIAVWDAQHRSSIAKRHDFGPGAYLYWREE